MMLRDLDKISVFANSAISWKNRRGNSVIEVVVVVVIISIGIVGTYGILESGQKLSTASENRIKAINIAREWLEAVENMRDTNWIKFSSDYDNCWKVRNYDGSCIGNTGKSFPAGSYILVQSGALWMLSGTVSPLAYTGWYASQFPVYMDSHGLTTSSWSSTSCTALKTTDCKTIFTREIQISNPDGDRLKVNSIVKWTDSSKTTDPYTINLETVLTNWKKNL